MVEKELPVVVRAARKKRTLQLTAARVARWREKHGSTRPDTRRVDAAVSEALAVHVQTLPPAEAKAFLLAVHQLAVAGLEFSGFGPKSSATAVARRMATWTSTTLHSGSVRTAVARAELRT
jgi:hypothetical protein